MGDELPSSVRALSAKLVVQSVDAGRLFATSQEIVGSAHLPRKQWGRSGGFRRSVIRAADEPKKNRRNPMSLAISIKHGAQVEAEEKEPEKEAPRPPFSKEPRIMTELRLSPKTPHSYPRIRVLSGTIIKSVR